MTVNPNLQLWSDQLSDLQRVDPTWFDVSLIAGSLSKICRFNGLCPEFYSVAQHSVAVSYQLEGEGPAIALWGLLHDAAEYWLGDLCRPLKARLMLSQGDCCCKCRRIVEIEDLILDQLSKRFSLPWPMPRVVTKVDDDQLALEMHSLFVPLPCRRFRCWPHEEAARSFMLRYRELAMQRTGIADGTSDGSL